MVKGMLLIGEEMLLSRLSVEEREMNKKVAKAMQKAGGEIVRNSVQRTPLATGELRKRSFNEGPLKAGKSYTQVVGYEKFADNWDKDNAYAVPVHENLESHHPVGESQFLQKALNDVGPKLANYISKQVKL